MSSTLVDGGSAQREGASRLQEITSALPSDISGSGQQSASGKYGGKQQPSMHYEVPSLSSMLYEFTNKEQTSIINAFRIGNYTGIRDLPNNIAPNNVLQQIQIKMNAALNESSVISQNKLKYSELFKQNTSGYFSKFDWKPDEFGRQDDESRRNMIDKKIKETNTHPFPFNANQNKRLLKHEYPFQDNKDEKFVYGFLCLNDPYEATKDERLRAKWIEEAKLLYGEFRPSGPQKPLSTIAKSRLEDIVETLKKLLLSDWNDVNFVIGTNPNDQLEIKFDLQTVDTIQGLHAYMNTMLNTNDEVIRFQLKKLPRYWGYREDNFVYYMLTPPWVKLYMNDVINQTKASNNRTAMMMQGHNVSRIGQSNKIPALFSRDINID